MEEENKRGKIEQRLRKAAKPITDILDRGDEMRKEGTLTKAQIAKETGIHAGYLVGVISTAVGGAVAILPDHDHISDSSTKPDKATETVLPGSPGHMKPAEQIIEDFRNKGEGFAGKSEKDKGSSEKFR